MRNTSEECEKSAIGVGGEEERNDDLWMKRADDAPKPQQPARLESMPANELENRNSFETDSLCPLSAVLQTQNSRLEALAVQAGDQKMELTLSTSSAVELGDYEQNLCGAGWFDGSSPLA